MESTIRRLQLIQLEILKTVDGICEKHNLKYSLYAGTLLGAVRHKGFIPWDDDLDICMPREDYEKLIDIWSQTPLEGYIFQNKDNSPEFAEAFAKVRKDKSTFLQPKEENARYHTGIFIDIFPFDRIPKGKNERKKLEISNKIYQLFTREFVPGKNKGSKFEIIIAKVLLKLVTKNNRKKARKWMLNRLTRYNGNSKLCYVTYATASSTKYIYPNYLFDNLVRMKFEDGEFSCFGCWDESLKILFGDYMTPPPEREREWKHHPTVIDFERNYDEIKEHHNED